MSAPTIVNVDQASGWPVGVPQPQRVRSGAAHILRMQNFVGRGCVALCLAVSVSAAPGDPDEPVRVLNDGIDLGVHDGRLRPAIGTESIQVFRANRTRPDWADGFGWTYNHAPMLAYWNGRFHLEYLSTPFGEHVPPGQTMLVNSIDGRTWDLPRQAFPIYLTRPGPISGTESGMMIMHQRMGFYVSPAGRLLVLAFYGRAPSPWGATGVGRVVREANKDGSLGPIYFIRYNSLGTFNETNTRYPLYTKSPDRGFIEACDALLADKLKTMQWHEEDRSTDGFYTVPGRVLEAPSVFHRKDGMAVALWKASWAGLSSDEGRSWSQPVRVPSIVTDGAKTWGQRTDDGRYAIVYNPANFGSHRWPLAIATGDDGITFENMLLINGEVPPRRYFGRAKDFGLQYVRGISEGDGNPPGDDLWVTYSMNKEDMWVSRVPVPVRHKVTAPVDDNFDRIEDGGRVPDWNLYRPRWANVAVASFPDARNKSLLLGDRDPYDYAKAVRVFPEAASVRLSCRILAKQTDHGRLELELLDHAGHRAVQVTFDEKGGVSAMNGSQAASAGRYRAGAWHRLEIVVAGGKFDVSLDGRKAIQQAAFAEPATTLERLSLRTGPYRSEPTRQTDRYAGEDLPAPDAPVATATFHLDDVVIK